MRIVSEDVRRPLLPAVCLPEVFTVVFRHRGEGDARMGGGDLLLLAGDAVYAALGGAARR